MVCEREGCQNKTYIKKSIVSTFGDDLDYYLCVEYKVCYRHFCEMGFGDNHIRQWREDTFGNVIG